MLPTASMAPPSGRSSSRNAQASRTVATACSIGTVIRLAICSAEPEPMRAEEPRRFESLVFWGLAEDLFSPSRAAEFLQRPIDQLEPALQGSTVSA